MSNVPPWSPAPRVLVLAGLLATSPARAADDAPESPADAPDDVPEGPADAPEDDTPEGPADAPEDPADTHDHDDPFPDHADDASVIEVHGEAAAPARGAGDMRVAVPEAQAVHPHDAEEALKLAPGMFLMRQGGDGAPMRLFLRGFDARHGQDVAFHLDGLPVNQVGNPHGHGLVDLRLVPAEAIAALDVRPGPTHPGQGDFAVAGSIDVELGMAEPGLLMSGTVGSFGTARGLLGWRHPEERGTFLLGEVTRTDGYGQNRGGLRGNAVARIARGPVRFTGGVAASDYDHAGFIRRIDVAQDRIGLYDTPDARQGVGATHAWAVGHIDLATQHLDGQLDLSLSRRSTWIRTNFTGFLTDDRRPGESPHPQRGDLLDQRHQATTAHLDGRVRRDLELGTPWALWALEAGLRGRFDDVDAQTLRLRDVDGQPYRTELDIRLQQASAGMWAGGIAEGGLVTARLGGRLQGFVYQLQDRCAAQDTWFPGAETDDVNCPDEDRNGPRRRDAHRTASGLGVAPRGSVAVNLLPGHTLLAGGGRGFRSIQATALSAGEDAPFGDLWSGDLGWRWTASPRGWFLDHRLVGYGTWVRRDLLLDEIDGTNVPAGSTTRWGATLTSEVHNGPLRVHSTLTGTHATFGDTLPPNYVRFRDDRKPGQLVPYVPMFMARTDATWTWRLQRLGLRHGLAATYVAPRPLPWSTWSEPVFTVDASTELRYGPVELGLALTNLFNARYALVENTFASFFPDVSGADHPTRLPARHVSPGAPRMIRLTLTLHPEAL